MTPRPYFTRKERPLSAIFIGSLGSNSTLNTASPPDLPKLPEPPGSSPGSSSGLPSPPATNSTGSGSLGDETTNTNSSRQRSTQRPPIPSNMYDGSEKKTEPDMSSTSTLMDDDDEHHDNEYDEDNTARLGSSRRRPSTSRDASVENMSALERVKSLTERNRKVLDKLSSISRSSPLPGPSKTPLRNPFSATNTPSPAPGATPRSRPQSTSKLRSPFPIPIDDRGDPGHSGSETERESTRVYTHSYSSSDSMSNTPTSSYAPPEFVRQRQLSAPSSPAKSPRKSRQSSPGPSRTPRKRASMAASVSDVRRNDDGEDYETEDVTKAALAAVASSRRSPGSVSRRNLGRQPLPKEFRERDSRSTMGDRSEPATPQRERFLSTPRSPSPSRTPSRQTSVLPTPSQSTQRSPRRLTVQRVSTVRELTRRHQTRWLSEDLSGTAMDADAENETPSRSTFMSTTLSGRRQGHRSGSSESPFTGRTLLGEGLRAAGLSRKQDVPQREVNGDVFVNGREVAGAQESSPGLMPLKRALSTGARSVVSGHGEWDSPSPVTINARTGIGDIRTPASALRALNSRTPGTRSTSGSYVTPARPVTSMAALHHETPSVSAPRNSTYRHSLDLQSVPSTSRLEEPIQLGSTLRQADRAYTPLLNSARRPTQNDGQAEHQKLLMDALSTFESQLSRLPPMGHTTTTTIPDVFQNSQQIVDDLDKLNSLLRQSLNSAMEAEVQAELADVDVNQVQLAELWLNIGKEHREHLRLTEGLVRTLTQFFLGVGKVLREATGPVAQNHTRAISLDEQAARRGTPEGSSSVTSSEKRSADGRASRELRRSWEPRTAEEIRAVSRLASRERPILNRPPSVAQTLAHSSATSSSEGRSTGAMAREQTHTPPITRTTASTFLSTTTRRYSPKETRSASDPAATLMSSLDSQETLRAQEPSPAALTNRSTHSYAERTRALPPLSIPPSLPTLPSESLLRQTSSVFDRSDRRKVSTSSTMTVRAESSLPPVIKPPNTTTALTTAPVSIESPVSFGSALSRTDSSGSSHANGVTFSRPSPDSLSTLSGLRQHGDSRSLRQRTLPTSAVDPSPMSLKSPMSGSETERPRTATFRARTALEKSGAADDGGTGSRASTLTSSRRERRRTVTAASEIFSNHNGR